MTLELFLKDPYLPTFSARVVRNSGRELVLDRTAFYPGGAGQPPDKGSLGAGPVNASVIEVRRSMPDDPDDFDDDFEKENDGPGDRQEIIHVLDRALPRTVRKVDAALDWPRRYRNMRYNTALALLSDVAARELGARVGSGRIRTNRARLDLLEPSVAADDAAVRRIEAAANGVVSDGLEVGARTGGLHVKNASEVGRISVSRWMDRRRRGVRLEFTLQDPEGDA